MEKSRNEDLRGRRYENGWIGDSFGNNSAEMKRERKGEEEMGSRKREMSKNCLKTQVTKQPPAPSQQTQKPSVDMDTRRDIPKEATLIGGKQHGSTLIEDRDGEEDGSVIEDEPRSRNTRPGFGKHGDMMDRVDARERGGMSRSFLV